MCRERRQKTQQIGGGVREGFLEEGALELFLKGLGHLGTWKRQHVESGDRGEGLIK